MARPRLTIVIEGGKHSYGFEYTLRWLPSFWAAYAACTINTGALSLTWASEPS